MSLFNSVSEIIGNTPLVRVNNFEKKHNVQGKIFAKLEYLNPAGSVKDRVGKGIIDEAEKSGKLNKDTVIIEPTSGNTGIGLASYCAAKGYHLLITMPESMSVERRNLMKAYGAELVLTDGSKGMPGAIAKAKELNEQMDNSIIAGQFTNPVNPLVHYQTTGPEIYRDTNGEVDIVIAGVGTGGTISGISKYLKEQKPEVISIALEPENSPMISKGTKGPHKIQGIGAGFVPDNYNGEYVDEVMTVPDQKAMEFAKEFPAIEGAMVGISSGAALWAATEVAKKYPNKNIVVILPDSGDRYLSTEVFA